MLPIKCVCFLVTWICLHTIMLSKVTKHILYGRKIHLIRDDLLNVNGISGNKIRKLAYFMNDPHSIPDTTNTVVSFGGCQSNAMVAISQLVNNLNSIRNNKLQFIYFTKYLSPSVMSNPIGNLKDALDLGMQVCNSIYIYSVIYI